MSIFVGNLPFRAEQEDVIELFAQFGEVTNCALPLERDTGRKRGFAFIEMADESTEEAAIEGLQGAELMGRPLRINKAEPRGSAPRRGGGGYGGGGGGGYDRDRYDERRLRLSSRPQLEPPGVKPQISCALCHKRCSGGGQRGYDDRGGRDRY